MSVYTLAKQRFSAITLVASLLFTISLASTAVAEDTDAGDINAGKAKAATCSACHGQGGVSTTPIWPNLAGQGEKYLVKQIKDIQSNDRKVPTMTGFVAGLSEQDIADIAAYYASLNSTLTGAAEKSSEAYGLNAEQFLALGEKIYRSGNAELSIPACSACHSPTGKGNAPALYPQVGGQHYDYLVQQLKDFRGNLRTNDGQGKLMRGAVENLKDVELEAVANYISGLN